MRDDVRDAPIEVEVERLDPGTEEGEPQGGPGSGARARARAGAGDWGPIVAGLLLDLADVATPRNPKIGLAVGLVVGFAAGSRLGLPMRSRLMLAAVGAAYCSLSATTPLPIGTVVGFLYRAGLFGRKA